MHVRHFSVRSHLFTRKGLTMGGTPNGLKQFLLQGRTTIKENVFQNCLRSYPLWEGMMDFHAWVGSKITHGCFYILFSNFHREQDEHEEIVIRVQVTIYFTASRLQQELISTIKRRTAI